MTIFSKPDYSWGNDNVPKVPPKPEHSEELPAQEMAVEAKPDAAAPLVDALPDQEIAPPSSSPPVTKKIRQERISRGLAYVALASITFAVTSLGLSALKNSKDNKDDAPDSASKGTYLDQFASTEPPKTYSFRGTCDPLVREMAKDGKITDDELIRYGQEKGLFVVLSDEEFYDLQKENPHFIYDRPFIRNKINPDSLSPDRNPIKISLDTGQSVNIDEAIAKAESAAATSLLLDNTRDNGRDVTVPLSVLKKTKAAYMKSQQTLGLQNVPLNLKNIESPISYANYAPVGVYMNIREFSGSQASIAYVANHELGHIKGKVSGASRHFSKDIQDHASENFADSIAAALSPSAPVGVFRYHICTGEEKLHGTRSAFMEHLKKCNTPNSTDSHAPGLEIVKRVMLISARTFD